MSPRVVDVLPSGEVEYLKVAMDNAGFSFIIAGPFGVKASVPFTREDGHIVGVVVRPGVEDVLVGQRDIALVVLLD